MGGSLTKLCKFAILLAAIGMADVSIAESCWEEQRCVKVTGIGLGAISDDGEVPLNAKQIAAIRAAKIDALRSISEQIKGVKVTSLSQTSSNGRGFDRVTASSESTLVGVTFVKIEPLAPGIYQATAEMYLHF